MTVLQTTTGPHRTGVRRAVAAVVALAAGVLFVGGFIPGHITSDSLSHGGQSVSGEASGVPISGSAVAAPNPLRDSSATHLIRIAADGSYTVKSTTTIDLALETTWGFGGEIHDGFRLPDTESLLPSYLRAEYSQPRGNIDGSTVEATIEEEIHAVDIGFETKTLEPGTHQGVVDYRVTGAAVPAESSRDGSGDSHVTVYFRPLERGDLVIESAAPVSAVSCEELAPIGQPCGTKGADRWTVPAEDLEDADRRSIDAVNITIDADPDELDEPVIDS